MNPDSRAQMVALLPRLRRFCCGLTGSELEGDELVQMTCERALSRLHQWQNGTRLDSWMYRIAQTIWLNRIRQEKARKTVADSDLVEQATENRTNGDPESGAQLREVLEHLSRLPSEQREAVMLVCVEGYSYKETAEILDIRIGTVMSRLSRARSRLNGLIFGEGDAEEGLRQGIS